MRRLIPLMLLCACKADTAPAWAFDPIWIEPDGSAIHGVHTWQMYSERWHEKRKEKFYLCSIVVELWGEPTTCDDCLHAWAVDTELLETDCDPAVAQDPMFVSLAGLGIGELTSDPGAPHPGNTATGYADYGSGAWEVHGWAYPDALDAGGSPTSPEWDGEQPFVLWPTLDWPVQ